MTTPRTILHKQSPASSAPTVSLILLDWSCRERFHALDWLARQNIPRNLYEVIWVELYDRVVPEVLEKADVVITCNQHGLYHKHVGYNIGLLQARGQTITICDSDAIFPPDFVASLLHSFRLNSDGEPRSQVLMHYERRSLVPYPADLRGIEELQRYPWTELHPNVGACMTVLREDAIRFGGFDEHPSYRGYLCGPYDLGWRMINFGIPEHWHDESVTLWHFAHPEPGGSYLTFSWKRWREITHPHFEYHALTAVEALATGRLLPLQENPDIHQLRLAARRIGSDLEMDLARRAVGECLGIRNRIRLRLSLYGDMMKRVFWTSVRAALSPLKNHLPEARRRELKKKWIAPSQKSTR